MNFKLFKWRWHVYIFNSSIIHYTTNFLFVHGDQDSVRGGIKHYVTNAILSTTYWTLLQLCSWVVNCYMTLRGAMFREWDEGRPDMGTALLAEQLKCVRVSHRTVCYTTFLYSSTLWQIVFSCNPSKPRSYKERRCFSKRVYKFSSGPCEQRLCKQMIRPAFSKQYQCFQNMIPSFPSWCYRLNM